MKRETEWVLCILSVALLAAVAVYLLRSGADLQNITVQKGVHLG